MKILFAAHEGDLNGSSKSLINLIDILSRTHTVFVLTSYKEGKFVEELKKHNCTVWYAPYFRWVKTRPESPLRWLYQRLKWFGYEQWINRSSAKKIAAMAKGEGIDLIHSNTRVIDIGGLVGRYANIPHIWHFREFGEEDFRMYPVTSVKKHYGQVSRMAEGVIMISDAIQAKFAPLLDEKVQVFRIYNGVDDTNVWEKQPFAPEKISFLISGRISPTKGQKDVVKAAQLLLEKGYTNFKIYMAGTMSSQFQLFDRETEHVQEYVELLGQISDMPKLRRDMDVELVCSKAEAFGRVTVEAMMGSLPVIGSAAGGTLELIQEGVTGYLYEQGNPQELAEKMQRFLDNPELVYRLGHAAWEETKEYFLIERCAAEIAEVYKKVTERVQ